MNALRQSLAAILPAERIKSRLIDLVAYASDAGFYHLVPKVVVQPASILEVQQLFLVCNKLHIPLTFRAGGSSLSGQAITDGILADLSQHWRKTVPGQDGAFVRVQPGVTGSVVNYTLKKYQSKIGPDPSSINTAMMGGILSNNASGMCCGVKLNSYHTLRSLHFVLPDGKEYNTENADDYNRFAIESRELFDGILNLRARILQNEVLRDRIRKKYLTKNTVGYSLNAFVDYDHPLDIFAHLLIGAEGTLAFIAEAVMNTVPDFPEKATSILFFDNLYNACSAILPIADTGAEMIELMDRASLRSIEHINGIPAVIKSLPETAAALLVEYQDNSAIALQNKLHAFNSLSSFQLLFPAAFTSDTAYT